MIRNIQLTNFKCFENLPLRTRPLTIIAGGNAAGKSSIIQSLLLLAQSKSDILDSNKLRVSDNLTDLVNSEQIRFVKSDSPEIKIEIYDDLMDDDISVKIPNALQADKQPQCEASANMPEAVIKLPLFADDFVYLNANRLTPQTEYLKGNDERFYSRLGDRTGHRTVFRLQEALDNNESVTIESLKLNGKESVAANVNSWISHIMGTPISVSADGNPSEGKASLTYNTPSTGTVGAVNMAFGNTYILPIILGVLTAPKGSLLIIENPEAHLHPKAQLRMGEFLATAAEGGIQIFVETHSDHLLNGVRVAAKKHEIDPLNVTIYFIKDKDSQHSATEIELHSDGTLDKWPDGFFDEWEKALRDIVS